MENDRLICRLMLLQHGTGTMLLLQTLLASAFIPLKNNADSHGNVFS